MALCAEKSVETNAARILKNLCNLCNLWIAFLV